jgi:hypothetical protein
MEIICFNHNELKYFQNYIHVLTFSFWGLLEYQFVRLFNHVVWPTQVKYPHLTDAHLIHNVFSFSYTLRIQSIISVSLNIDASNTMGNDNLPLDLTHSEKLFANVAFLSLPNRFFPPCNENPWSHSCQHSPLTVHDSFLLGQSWRYCFHGRKLRRAQNLSGKKEAKHHFQYFVLSKQKASLLQPTPTQVELIPNYWFSILNK